MPIDIHGLQKRYESMPDLDLPTIRESVKEFRATLQGRKKELLEPFGLDDLDNFKNDPTGFVDAVKSALDAFAEKKEHDSLYKKAYEDERCLITMPMSPKGAAAAGSFFKKEGNAVCPWCVAVKYPDNEKWWKHHKVEALFFVYAKKNGIVSNTWCLVLTLENCHHSLEGVFSLSHIEDTENKGTGDEAWVRDAHLENMFKETGMNRETLCSVFRKSLAPRHDKINERYRNALLLEAVRLEKLDECKRLLDAGADVNTRNERKSTPLITAARCGKSEICKMLLDAGADVNAINNNSWTPLITAADCGKTEICKLLIEAGADMNAQNNDGDTALIAAAGCGRTRVCKLLIDAGADVEIQNKKGRSALLAAALFDYDVICKMLLDAGADVNCRDKDDWTALIMAAEHKPKLCKILLDAGADVNAKENDGWTPLMIAADFGKIEICKMFIDAGADVNCMNRAEMSALMWAIVHDKTKICKMLIDAGADVNARSNVGWTPLKFASYYASPEMSEILKAAGGEL